MIYFISDCHAIRTDGLKNYVESYKPGDLLIVLGDLGIKFEKTEENRKFTEYFLSIDKPIAIVDGNHENHPYLNSLPEEEWRGGKINRLTKNIIRLKRGHIFTLEGNTFFVMGGCKSSAKWKPMGLWFEGEEPTPEEIAFAYKNLSAHSNKVDYILTHKYHPDMHGDDPMTLEGLKDYIDEKVDFKKWYAGHWHGETVYDERHVIVFDTPTPLGT